MIKVESEILNKSGKRENWREIAFFASDDETQFEVREYQWWHIRWPLFC